MWSFASNSLAGCIGVRNGSSKLSNIDPESKDEVFSCTSKEEGLECPICWESFNIVENSPCALWCGHTFCKNCVLRLQWAIVKFPNLPIQLPLFISCPWCNLLSFRLVYKGILKFPRKNFYLLWMVESMNGERQKSCSHRHSSSTQYVHRDHSNANTEHLRTAANDYWNAESIRSFLLKLLVFFVHLTAKFPLIIIFVLIIIYAIPASAIILVLYIVVTLLLALPSFLMLYFAYPSLDWLVREIIT